MTPSGMVAALRRGMAAGGGGGNGVRAGQSAEIFVRYGLEEASLAQLRGWGTVQEDQRKRFLAFAENRAGSI